MRGGVAARRPAWLTRLVSVASATPGYEASAALGYGRRDVAVPHKATARSGGKARRHDAGSGGGG